MSKLFDEVNVLTLYASQSDMIARVKKKARSRARGTAGSVDWGSPGRPICTRCILEAYNDAKNVRDIYSSWFDVVRKIKPNTNNMMLVEPDKKNTKETLDESILLNCYD